MKIVTFYKNFAKGKGRGSRILSSKTKFLDSYLYNIGLSCWLRYKDCSFRWEEVLFFLEIPPPENIYDDLDLSYFAEKVEEKLNGRNFYDILIEIQVYFNQDNLDLEYERLKKFKSWRSSRKKI